MIWDILFILGRPLGYLSSILDLKRLIQTKTAKNRSLIAWIIAFLLPIITLFRAMLSVHDLIFTLNAIVVVALSTADLILIVKWRNQ